MKNSVSNQNSRRQTVLQKRFLYYIFHACAFILISELKFQSETKSGKIGHSAIWLFKMLYTNLNNSQKAEKKLNFVIIFRKSPKLYGVLQFDKQ